jgi:hypothetical protein
MRRLLAPALVALACAGRPGGEDAPLSTDPPYLDLEGVRVARYTREATGDFSALGTEVYYAYFEGEREIWHGPAVGYYPSGKRSYAGRYRQGRREGRFLYWSQGGIKIAEAHYRDGELDGLEGEWTPDGQRKCERTWVAGVLDGTTTWWSPNGELFTGTYVAGKPMDGIFVELLPTGERKLLQYRDGEPVAALAPPDPWWW